MHRSGCSRSSSPGPLERVSTFRCASRAAFRTRIGAIPASRRWSRGSARSDANRRAYLLARVDFEQVQQSQALEQPLEHPAHGEHRRPAIDRTAFGHHLAQLAAGGLLPLDHQHRLARRREQGSGAQSAHARASLGRAGSLCDASTCPESLTDVCRNIWTLSKCKLLQSLKPSPLMGEGRVGVFVPDCANRAMPRQSARPPNHPHRCD